MTTPGYPVLPSFPRLGFLVLLGWHGDSSQPVRVIGETPKRWRIEPTGQEPVRLAGKRWVRPGSSALVPKHAVRFAVEGGRS